MKNFLIIIALFFVFTNVAGAALVSIDAPQIISNKNQFNVIVNLDTDGNSINSIDFSVSYPKDILTFNGYKEDGSIKKIWLVSPKEEKGEIHFSGIIPGGVEGVYDPDKKGLQPIPLAVLLFSPKENGTGVFNIEHSDVLQNDGQGTPLVHENSGSQVTIANLVEQETENTNVDKTPPEPFTIQYIPSGFFSRTPAMISFFTIDIDSGVKKYMLYRIRGSWKEVESPLPMPRGILNRNVVLKAIDFSGNSREASVGIPGLLSPLQLFSIVIFGLTCYFLFFVVKRKR